MAQGEGLEVTVEDKILEEWLRAVRAVILLSKGARLRELRGERRARSFTSEGFHPQSVEWGRIFAFEQLVPGLAECRDTGGSPFNVFEGERLGAEDAHAAFLGELADGQVPWAG